MKEQMKTLVAIISFFLVSISTAVEARPSRVPAIYVFGDSTADVGNNNHLQVDENTRANFPHNGVDYPGGIPTGRFGNGYIAVDFLAQRMGFKESPPAYFKLTHKGQEIHGVNFASGGSGVLDMTGVNRSFSMNTQIDLFEKIKTHLFHRKGKLGSNHFLSDSLFIISTVNNDIFEFFQRSSTTAAINITIVERQISLLSSQLKNQIMKLYTLGARQFVVFGSAALGCAPFMRRLNPTGGCLDPLNQMSSLFNVAMKAELQGLRSVSNGTMKYSFVNSFDIFLDISSRPSHYGFKDLTSACCGSGRFNADTLCLPNVTYCANRREFTSWDFTHPTQAVYEIVADYAFNGGPKFATPINVNQLIEHRNWDLTRAHLLLFLSQNQLYRSKESTTLQGGNSSIPISAQILQFKETTKALAKQLGQESAAKHLSESMFLFSTGSNDLIATAFTYGYQNKTVRKDFVNLLASDYKHQLKEMYNFGARKMVIINVGRIGCVPLIRNTKKSGNCNNKFNKFAGELDKAVTEMLQDLSSTCKGLKYSYIKTDVIGSLIASKFREYGFVQPISACCGTGRFNAQGFCTPSANLCPNRDQYFFWDPVHPTQAFYKLQADFAYTGNSSVATPINVKELASI